MTSVECVSEEEASGVEETMTYLPVWQQSMTPELAVMAERELGETAETRSQAIKDMKGLLKDIPDLNTRTDDAFLLRFLRARKFDVRKATRTLRNYYTFKARYSRILTDFLPSEMMGPMTQQDCCMGMMPRRKSDHSSIGVMRPAFFDFDVVSPNQIFASILLAAEVLLQLESTQVAGYSIIFDLTKLSFKTVKTFSSPTFIYRIVKLVQDCMPCRIKSFHFVNEPFYFNIFFSIAKPFLSEKLSKRVHFHGSNYESLYKLIPQELLPEELGGLSGPLQMNDLVSRLIQNEAYFEKINKFGFHGNAYQDVKRKNSRSLFD